MARKRASEKRTQNTLSWQYKKVLVAGEAFLGKPVRGRGRGRGMKEQRKLVGTRETCCSGKREKKPERKEGTIGQSVDDHLSFSVKAKRTFVL